MGIGSPASPTEMLFEDSRRFTLRQKRIGCGANANIFMPYQILMVIGTEPVPHCGRIVILNDQRAASGDRDITARDVVDHKSI